MGPVQFAVISIWFSGDFNVFFFHLGFDWEIGIFKRNDGI